MIKAILYGPGHTETYLYPTGAVADPARVLADYPGIAVAPMLMTVRGKTIQSMQDFDAMRDHYGIDDSLSEAEALAAIEYVINNPPAQPEPDPTAEERIAAALEFQAINSLPTV